MTPLNKVTRWLFDRFYYLRRNTIELNNYSELKKLFRWEDPPVLDRPGLYDFEYPEDVNERRLRDTESIATVMRNAKPRVALEIGTSTGMGTVLMAVNAPESQIFTVNIPPEEILSGAGGKATTIALEKSEIGKLYRERGLKNITQIYANTATWKPDIGQIEFAFIDGCHDKEFVYNDTRKVLHSAKPGCFVLWHDFNLDLVDKHEWIGEVCLGVEKLFRRGLIKGRVYHIRDSWVGIYRVE